VSAILFCVSLLGSRNPHEPRWASDFWVGSVYIPGLMGFFFMGVSFFVKMAADMDQANIGTTESIVSAAVIAVTVVIIKAMKVKKTLAAYGRESSPASVVDMRPHPELPSKPGATKLAA